VKIKLNETSMEEKVMTVSGQWKSDPLDAAMVCLSLSAVFLLETVSEVLSKCLETSCSASFKHAGGFRFGIFLFYYVHALLRLGRAALVCTIMNLTAILKQLEVDIDVLKQEKKTQDENLATLTEKNEQLMEHVLKDTSQINDLHCQLHNLNQHAFENSTALEKQLETLQKEFVEQTSSLEEERSSCVVAMLHAAKSLEESIQQVSFDFCSESDCSTVNLHLSTLVNATIEKINKLRGLKIKLELCCRENTEIQRSFEKLTRKLELIQQERESAVRVLNKTHSRLRNLIGLQDKMDAENEEMLHSLHIETKDTEGDGKSVGSVLSCLMN
jgi:hypothetical protein